MHTKTSEVKGVKVMKSTYETDGHTTWTLHEPTTVSTSDRPFIAGVSARTIHNSRRAARAMGQGGRVHTSSAKGSSFHE